MTREELEIMILDRYGVRADYPFEDDLETGVFRHTGTGKWFALAMNINAQKLGKCEKMQTSVVNLKCAPEIIESLVGKEPGIYRAYHMNKLHWLTAVLSECTSDILSWLLDISYDLTRGKKKGLSH
ncbi:MAG: MmcQ/YjbR family DNA-binding protein [Ruminococcaceae bacterium]|nr:MmcQ/YjbR family DNA-binding protein [Oscillospiraceae bacterium]